MTGKVRSVLLAAALLATGCSHALRLTNAERFHVPPTPPLQPSRTIGVRSPNVGDPHTRGYVDAIVEAVRRDATFDRVLYPFDASQHDADVVVDVAVRATYDGKGTNFLVNWPGFLIFAPAIWGYGYEANIETKVLLRTRDGAARDLVIPTFFEFRQAEIDRTWTEIGWLEVGIIPLIGGLVFTSYDPDVTPEFITKVAPYYGSYVVQRTREALGRMSAAGPRAPPGEPEVIAMPPPPAEPPAPPPDAT
jgi:hypothetical protein